MQGAEEQELGNKNAGERFLIPKQELRRTTRAKKMPQYFENFAKVATRDYETIEEAMESSENEQWKKAIKEELKSIENNAT